MKFLVPGNPTFRIFINGSLDLLLFPNYSQQEAMENFVFPDNILLYNTTLICTLKVRVLKYLKLLHLSGKRHKVCAQMAKDTKKPLFFCHTTAT